jgi:hypothetical protein
MGRERFLFVPFPRPVGPPFGILTYPDGRVGVIHRSAWRNCLENRDSLQFAAPSVGNGGREAPFRSPVPSNIHHRETRQLFSKQFLQALR